MEEQVFRPLPVGHSHGIGCDRLIVIAIGGSDAIASPLTTADALLLHDASDAVASVAKAICAQLDRNARAAVGFTASSMDVFDLLSQRPGLNSPQTWSGEALAPVVVAAGRRVQRSTERQD